ncbi:hypothetical protein DPMN_104970 [Dreissena polymorpha]|uniref:Uncharacterized protein n=1 Tax=Dreissena polymorpha TaxID=45954 RepID=A0A9D4HAZ5_DREPO|nr:hypothetical protein DPMN_104970 [Dreissena polymorpha]
MAVQVLGRDRETHAMGDDRNHGPILQKKMHGRFTSLDSMENNKKANRKVMMQMEGAKKEWI